MGAKLESYHSHDKGDNFGWWGTMWHPAHFDEDGKEIPGSAWKLEISEADGVYGAIRSLFEQWLHNRDKLFKDHEHERE